MKPIRVRFGCFGPYVAEQEIDFASLEKQGLFLICGETGAGKTTILDAICYALYGRSSGGLRGDLSAMRCKLAQKDQDTFTEFTFESGGEIYQFVRRLKYGRKNLNDSHNCLKYTDGVFVPIFENPKQNNVNKKAEELIGLSYEQFCQVIILPQGQFERLLVSDSAEKEKILVTLFHADRWQKITEEIIRRVQEQDKQLQTEHSEIMAKLKQYGCVDVEMLGQRIEETADLLTQTGAQWKAAQTRLTACREENERVLLENRDFAQLDSLKHSYEMLFGRLAAMDAEASRLALAEKAEALQPGHRQYQTALQEKQKTEKEFRAAQGQLEAAIRNREAQEQNRQRQDARRPEFSKRKENLLRMENARSLYAQIPHVRTAAQEAQQRFEQVKNAYLLARKKVAALEQAKQNAAANQVQAIAQNQRIQAAYLQNIGYTLARQLTDGQPCPVCGSVHHPSPARNTGETVTQEQLENSQRAVEAALKGVSQAEKALAEAQQMLARRQAEGEEARAAKDTAAKEQEVLESQLLPGIDSPARLENQIREDSEKIRQFTQAEEQLQRLLNEAQAAVLSGEQTVSNKKTAWEQAVSEFAAEETRWQKALADAGFADETAYRAACLNPEEYRKRHEALIQFRTQLDAAREAWEAKEKALSGKLRPDLAGISARLQQCQAEERQLDNRMVLQKRELETMSSDREKLAKREEAYRQRRAAMDENLEFARRLRGTSGISLQRYVLGVMLNAITVEANRLLSRVYGGRYRLYRTDAISGSGHKGGLELEVFDDQNSQRRSVTTLSGGEKFLVALSLAIGLSTVVQAQGQGIRLEAMFIDEGFGSLDREAVLDALEVLRSIQQGSGTVGIISHVEALAEIIPTRLEITKGRQGSSCRIVG